MTKTIYVFGMRYCGSRDWEAWACATKTAARSARKYVLLRGDTVGRIYAIKVPVGRRCAKDKETGNGNA